MALPRQEFRRRVLAGAALHGLGMRSLRDHLQEFGADKTLAEEMVRNETARRRRKNIRDLAEALDLPQAWFTEVHWWTLIDGATEPPEDAAEPGSVPEGLIPPEDRPDDAEDEAEQS